MSEPSSSIVEIGDGGKISPTDPGFSSADIASPSNSQSAALTHGLEAEDSCSEEEDVQWAEAVKRSGEPRDSKNFRKMISDSKLCTGWRLQEGPCASAYYTPCIACTSKIQDDCRFYNRMLRSIANPRLCRRISIGDVKQFLDEKKVEKSKSVSVRNFWPSFKTKGRKIERAKKKPPSGKDAHMAAYIIQCVKGEFEKMVKREERFREMFGTDDDIFFNHSYLMKQVCDACFFSIFNLHYCCVRCGTELCLFCYDELHQSDKGACSLSWLDKSQCLHKDEHKSESFHLASFLPVLDLAKNVLNRVERLCGLYGIHNEGSRCNGNHGRRIFQEEKCYCPRPCSSIEANKNVLCRIQNQHDPDAIGKFKVHMEAHIPVVVEAVNEHDDYYASIWSRDELEKLILSEKTLPVLDCETFQLAVIKDKIPTLREFWKKFNAIHAPGEPYLKIKDFPETEFFADVAPEQYNNLFDIMPFIDYTHVNMKESGLGFLNLLNVLDEEDGADPGPKGYIAVGLCDAPHLASTALHLDVSDAANFLAYVQTPWELSRGDLSRAIEKRLILEGVSEAEKTRVMKNPTKAGALWKVFHPDDTLKLKAALTDWRRFMGQPTVGDAIHNQDVVLTPPVINYLKEKGINCYIFVQCEGEVVFVPAGAAHHVQNLNSCVKVAEDFAAVEGINHITEISKEMRCLKKGKGDLVQIDTVLYRACSKAADILTKYKPGSVSSSF